MPAASSSKTRTVTLVAPESRKLRHGLQPLRALPTHDGGRERSLRGSPRAGRPGRDRRRVAECWPAGLAVSGTAGSPRCRAASTQRVALARAAAPLPGSAARRAALEPGSVVAREDASGIEARDPQGRHHDLFRDPEQDEAFALGDRVAVLNAGRLEQVGSAEALFEQPATRFVATFIGRSSVIPVRWEQERACRESPSGRLCPGHRCPRRRRGSRREAGGPDLLGARRPEALEGTVAERRYADVSLTSWSRRRPPARSRFRLPPRGARRGARPRRTAAGAPSRAFFRGERERRDAARPALPRPRFFSAPVLARGYPCS